MGPRRSAIFAFDERRIAGLAYGRNDKVPSETDMSRAIAVVIFPDFQILDATGPIAAFEIAGRITRGGYRLDLLSATGGEVASSSGVRFVTRPLGEEAYDTLLVAGGIGCDKFEVLASTVEWIRRRSGEM